jgi:hypothetical protein
MQITHTRTTQAAAIEKRPTTVTRTITHGDHVNEHSMDLSPTNLAVCTLAHA